MSRGTELPVLDLLSLITHYTSIAVDLSLYALASADSHAAREVLLLEREVDDYISKVIAGTAVAVRGPRQAKVAIGAVTLAEALDKISDAAGDLAGLILRGVPIHKFVSASSVCCNEVVALIRVEKRPDSQPSLIDILVARRGDEYILSPEWEDIRPADVLVVRGPLEEVEELARSVGYSIYSQLSRGTSALVAAIAGDELSSAILQMKSLARLMLDLAFHSLLYNDPSTAREVVRLEDEADDLYYKGIASAFAAGNPSASEEMVSIAVFMKSMESVADAATTIARLVIDGMVSELLVETVEEAEEAYLKLLATEELDGLRMGELELEDRGFLPMAIKSGSTLILPVPRDYRIRAGDILFVKYYPPETGNAEEYLRSRGFIVLPPGLPEE